MIKSGGWKSVVELPDEVLRSLEGKTIRKVETDSWNSFMDIIFEDGSVLSMMSLTMNYKDQLVRTLAEGTLTPMKYTLEEE